MSYLEMACITSMFIGFVNQDLLIAFVSVCIMAGTRILSFYLFQDDILHETTREDIPFNYCSVPCGNFWSVFSLGVRRWGIEDLDEKEWTLINTNLLFFTIFLGADYTSHFAMDKQPLAVVIIDSILYVLFLLPYIGQFMYGLQQEDER